MASDNPHVGDVGHRIEVDVMTSASVIVPLTGPVTMRLTAPSGASHDVTATLVSSGTTGVCYYDATTATLAMNAADRLSQRTRARRWGAVWCSMAPGAKGWALMA